MIKYEFKNSEIELNWFNYSYLTNTSSDFIEVKCGNSFETIFESQNGLQKVEVENKRITISHLNFNGTEPKIKRTENVCGYEIEYREVTSHEMYLKYQKTITDSVSKPKIELTKFKNGRWISTTDSLSGIEIKNEKWILFYKGIKTDSSDIYEFKIRREYFKELGTEHKPVEYLTLTNQSDTLEYSILEYNNELLSLSYIPRGNTLNYKPEK
ncbi:hypothetical protein [Lacinutrix cladophorae]